MYFSAADEQNQIALQQYTWKIANADPKEGEIKATKLFSSRYAANGEVVQLLIEEQSASLPKFGIRGLVAKKKKEEAMKLSDALQRFAKSYAELPPAKMQEFVQTARVTMESFKDLVIVLAISVLLIFMALVFQFKHAIKPFIAFAAVPFGMVGALAAL